MPSINIIVKAKKRTKKKKRTKEKKVKCKHCNDKKKLVVYTNDLCLSCGGTGTKISHEYIGKEYKLVYVTCRNCRSKGHKELKYFVDCHHCKG